MGKKSRARIIEERSILLQLFRQAGRPLGYREITDAYRSATQRSIAYTTLRARLDELTASGLLAREPQRRAPRYWAAEEPQAIAGEHGSEPTVWPMGKPGSASSDASETPRSAIPLSPDAKQARALLLRHAAYRAPSSYDFEFLDRYSPNVTAYLDVATRGRLSALGRTAAAGQPAGTYARDIMQRLVIDLSWGSSRLEGNKYTRIDTEELIRSGRDADGTSDRDRQMILNHKAAIEFLVESADDITFNRYTIQSLHALLAENLLDDRAQEGQLRQKAVTIGTSLYTPTALPQVIEERFDTLLQKAADITDPIEQAFFAMVHIPYLQPFIDVNKRTSRLAANIPLIKANLCPLSFVDVPEDLYTQGTLAVYEARDVSLLRDVFIWAYERSCQQLQVLREAMGEPDPIRLNYRLQLRDVVRTVILRLESPDQASLLSLAATFEIPSEDHRAFAREALLDIADLRPEVLARYTLRLSEYERWRRAVAPQRNPSTDSA